MIFLGVDPGKAGAIARIDGDRVTVRPVPLVKAAVVNGKKRGRDEYDLPTIAVLLQALASPGSLNAIVTVEASQTMPKGMGGALANFQRGVCRGWEWMLVALGIPYQLVHPRTWQRAMLTGTSDGDTKQRSIIAAKRLFPHVNLRRTERSRKDDDGKADAILLAEYGRRTYDWRLVPRTRSQP